MKQLKMNQKNKKKGFIVMFLGTLAVSLLGNMLTGKGVRRGGDGVIWACGGVIRGNEGVIWADKGVIKVGQDF